MQHAPFLSDLGMVNAIGGDKQAVFAALLAGERVGTVAESHAGKTFHVCRAPTDRASFRLNRLLELAYGQIAAAVGTALSRYGAARVGVVLGATDNGAEESRRALAEYLSAGAYPAGYALLQQEAHAAARHVAGLAGAAGPVLSVSTACTSSGSAIAQAARLIGLGVVDAVVAGGGDIVSDAVLLGFHALEAVDLEPCRPFSANRRGINLGEGAALFLLSRHDLGGRGIRLLGCGESADAHHMTAPDPQGRGALRAMRAALADAKLEPDAIDYVNLHGTGTALNDAMEALATAELVGGSVPCSSTKALVGHTLGAAAAMELGFCWMALSELNPGRRLPPHVWDGAPDPSLPSLSFCGVGAAAARLEVCMSNSYAFGGCNVSLLVGR